MKSAKKLASLLLVLALLLCLGGTALAADPTGTLTISNTRAGESYALYKVFDLSYSTSTTGTGEDAVTTEHFAYTINSAFAGFFTKDKLNPAGSASEAMSDSEAYTYVSEAGEASAADLATDFANWIKAQNPAVAPWDTVTAATGEATTTVVNNVPYGYYLMIPSSTNTDEGNEISALFSLDTVTPTVTIANKSTYPTIDKKILETVTTEGADGQEPTTVTNRVEANTASVGDTVNFELNNMKVPNMQGYEKYFYVIDDTLSTGLTLNADSFTVKIGDTTLTRTNTLDSKDATYSVIVDSQSFRIVFHNFLQYNTEALVGSDIVVTYSAVVNQNAVIGNGGNLNTVKLTYSNDPTATSDGKTNSPDEPGDGELVGVTPEEYTKTYVTGIELTKIDGTDKRHLAGAVFELTGTKVNQVHVIQETFTENVSGEYYLLKDGTYTKVAPITGMHDEYADIATKYTMASTGSWISTTESVKCTGTVSDSGVLQFEGLAAGDYVITELTAPTGYNLLETPINVTISMTAPNGATIDMDTATTATWTTTSGSIEDGIIKIAVANNSGTELPATGGIGTTLFYVFGSILLLGAVVLLVARKRVEASEK